MEEPLHFIKLLKSQHKSIINTVYEIDNQGGGPSNLKSSIEKLNKITDLLFDHLEKEDKQLYPTLLNNKETSGIAKKYQYDMERLSCIALGFFKRYCVNKEGLKIFVEDFVNNYSLFKGLLKVRIKREEIELYPAYVLLQSGVLYSEAVAYIQEQEIKAKSGQKRVIIFGQSEPVLKAFSLALEISGYEVASTTSLDKLSSMLLSGSDLVLLDVTNASRELSDVLINLREKCEKNVSLAGYSTNEVMTPHETVSNNLDAFIPQAGTNMEAFSEQVKRILTT